ncbi:MAG: glutamine synthetase III [Candidatus Wallbacteria bacterium]|nr:glutamine synthetase III [Candidatus Wallbacteria bacterium]
MNPRVKIIREISEKTNPSNYIEKGAVSRYFGENTLNTKALKEKLAQRTFMKLQKCISGEDELTIEVATEVAHAIKEWAISKGATHYCHWFQPLTGSTAEKHDSFLAFEDGNLIERFSGRQLVTQEPDASSFPSGGLRATFEARGYTGWDPTSPAFIKEGEYGKTLCIPSVFISYHGDSLDQKAPLLRSVELISQKTKELLALFGNKPQKVFPTIGAEQEFFLLDRDLANLRPDLVLTGRTIFGARPPKGQELEDQYFGSMPERIMNFINDVEQEVYKLGIPIVTRHNEVAPHQFELAPIFEDANLATDHNQLLMEVMKRKAIKHRLFLCLHEKPFARLNGSGKHVNWALAADGHNLLEPGENPEENLQFLTFLIAIVRGVYRYSALIRASVAFASNDHRLGGNEAPPAIISVFLGKGLSYVLDSIEQGKVSKKSVDEKINLGIRSIPKIPKDSTDRNRTSPFAFTGNKFEFRAVGSSQSISIPVTFLNTAVAESLEFMKDKISDKLARGFGQIEAVVAVLKEVIPEVRPVLFEGDGYSDEWQKEAKRRGLPNLKSTPEAMKAYQKPEFQKMFIGYGVFSHSELDARYHVEIEKYCKTVHIEGQTAMDIAKTKILPAALRYQGQLAGCIMIASKSQVQEKLLSDLAEKINELIAVMGDLEKRLDRGVSEEDLDKKAEIYCRMVMPGLDALRKTVDELETVIDDELWPLPKYYEMLFYY